LVVRALVSNFRAIRRHQTSGEAGRCGSSSNVAPKNWRGPWGVKAPTRNSHGFLAHAGTRTSPAIANRCIAFPQLCPAEERPRSVKSAVELACRTLASGGELILLVIAQSSQLCRVSPLHAPLGRRAVGVGSSSRLAGLAGIGRAAFWYWPCVLDTARRKLSFEGGRRWPPGALGCRVSMPQRSLGELRVPGEQSSALSVLLIPPHWTATASASGRGNADDSAGLHRVPRTGSRGCYDPGCFRPNEQLRFLVVTRGALADLGSWQPRG